MLCLIIALFTLVHAGPVKTPAMSGNQERSVTIVQHAEWRITMNRRIWKFKLPSWACVALAELSLWAATEASFEAERASSSPRQRMGSVATAIYTSTKGDTKWTPILQS